DDLVKEPVPDRAALLRQRLDPTLARWATDENIARAGRLFDDSELFDIALVMRLYIAPVLTAFQAHPRTILDMSDDEVSTRRRFAALRATVGQLALADVEENEAERYRVLEARWLPHFDDVLVCSEVDRSALAARTGHPAIHVIPNGVCIPVASSSRLHP